MFSIAGAAAEIAGEPFADVVVSCQRVFLQKIGAGHQHAGRAEAALQRRDARGNGSCSAFTPPAMPRPSTVAISGAIGLHGERQAGAHAVAVDQDRAGAADAVLAADVGAGQAKFAAQEIGEQ